MQWAFTKEDQSTSQAVFVNVPDCTTPPSIGEEIVSHGEIAGMYTVIKRQFMPIFPAKHDSDLKFGWSFILRPTQL